MYMRLMSLDIAYRKILSNLVDDQQSANWQIKSAFYLIQIVCLYWILRRSSCPTFLSENPSFFIDLLIVLHFNIKIENIITKKLPHFHQSTSKIKGTSEQLRLQNHFYSQEIVEILQESKADQLFLFQKALEMQQIMIRLEDRQSWKDSLRRCCRVNKLTIELASAYTPLRFRAAYARFKAIYQRRTEDRAERWLQNQLKAFQWFVVSLSLVTDILIRNFDQKQMEVLNDVFYFKQPMTLLYEVRKLSEDPTCKNSWVPQQQALLKDIVLGQTDCSNRWNEFARKLYENSQRKYFRTGKQCRQKWLNHLDPNKRHGEWTESQDMEVAKLFLSDGRKWSQVSKKMGGSRTQHMVKNRYKTILSRQKKLYPQVKNEYSLLKTFVFPDYAKKCANKAIVQEQQKKQRLENVNNSQQRQEQKLQVKDEHKSAEEYKPKMKQEAHHQENEYHPQNIEQLQSIVREEERRELKTLPQSSSGYQTMPQVFSPWYMGYPITPTFSPFYVNVSTFSAFDANINNQFYAPNRQSERSDQF